MEAADPSKVTLTIYQTTQCHKLEDHSLHNKQACNKCYTCPEDLRKSLWCLSAPLTN
jgi:hypothetical protein